MKRKFRTLAAVLAASLALVSCSRDSGFENTITQPTISAARVFTVSFSGNSTKTNPGTDGLTPKFSDGDVIKVANGTDAPQDCAVSVKGDEATISTTLSGALTAVYPAAAAKMSGNAIEGILVPTVQDGTFASANISLASVAANATEATFENQTAVFKLYVPDHDDDKAAAYEVKSVSVKSRGGEYIADGSKEITVGNGTASVADADGYCYVSLLPGETIKNLDVSAGAGLRTLSGEEAISANSLYSVALPVLNGYEYVEIGGKKWATMNVGATTVAGSASTCFGDYFAWGETTGHKLNDEMTAPADGHDFSWSTAPFNNGNLAYNSEYFLENKTEWLTGADVLKPAYDAATANWGSSWRMPTVEDFESLWTACTGDNRTCEPALPETITAGGVYWLAYDQTCLSEYIGVIGLLFVDKSDISKRVFFPAAGRVLGSSLSDGWDYGLYWSSSLYTGHMNLPDHAFNVFFNEYNADPSNYFNRFDGFPVRPFSE